MPRRPSRCWMSSSGAGGRTPPMPRDCPLLSMSNLLEPDFNPKAFLGLAKKLLANPDDPPALRTSISRSYYAAFLFTRRKLRLGRASHKDVWDALDGLGGVKCWKAVREARSLLRVRND